MARKRGMGIRGGPSSTPTSGNEKPPSHRGAPDAFPLGHPGRSGPPVGAPPPHAPPGMGQVPTKFQPKPQAMPHGPVLPRPGSGPVPMSTAARPYPTTALGPGSSNVDAGRISVRGVVPSASPTFASATANKRKRRY